VLLPRAANEPKKQMFLFDNAISVRPAMKKSCMTYMLGICPFKELT
jgi:hypothetical protein